MSTPEPWYLQNAARPTSQQVTAATIDRVAIHFCEQSWKQTGLAIIRCSAANRAGVISRTGHVTVDPSEIAANIRDSSASRMEIQMGYARLNVTFGETQQLVYLVPAKRSTAQVLTGIIGEAIVWGQMSTAELLLPEGSCQHLDGPLAPTTVIDRIRDSLSAILQPSTVQAIEWCCTGPGDFRAWRHCLACASGSS